MVGSKERPRCRKVIENLCKELDCTPRELLHHQRVFLSSGLKTQCRKMIAEDEGKVIE